MPYEADFTYKSITNFYDRVRSSLSMGVTGISDEEIDYPENAPLAEMRMKARYPEWAELDEAKFALFESCIVYATCYALCPVIANRRYKEQTTPSLTLKYADSVEPMPCSHFTALIDELMAEITGEELPTFTGFTVTKKYPCGCGWPYM